MEHASHPATKPPQSVVSLLLTIAPEIRNKIYEELFKGKMFAVLDRSNRPKVEEAAERSRDWSEEFEPRSPAYANILLSCRQTYFEALPVVHEQVQLLLIFGNPPTIQQAEMAITQHFRNIAIKCLLVQFRIPRPRRVFVMLDFDVALLSHFKQLKRLEFIGPARGIDLSRIEHESGEGAQAIMENLLELPSFKKCLPKLRLIQEYFRAKATDSENGHAYPSLSLKIYRRAYDHEAVNVFPCLMLLEDGSYTMSYDFGGKSYCLKGVFEDSKPQ